LTLISAAVLTGASSQVTKPSVPLKNQTKSTVNQTNDNNGVYSTGPLSPSEKRRLNAINVVSIILSNFYLAYTEQQEQYDVFTDLKFYLDYTNDGHSDGIIFVKNRLNHTVHRMNIHFDSLNPSKIIQYSSVKSHEQSGEQHVRWENTLSNSFQFKYDTSGRITIMVAASKGQEEISHSLRNYHFFYKDRAIDSIVDTDNLHRKRSVAFFNGKAKPDSMYYYGYTIPDGVVYFDKKELYVSKTGNERIKILPNAPGGYAVYRFKFDNMGRITHTEKSTKKDNRIWVQELSTYGYLPTSIRTGKTYNSTSTALLPADSIVSGSTPHQTTFTVNSKGQVVQEFITYSDACLDTEEIIGYTIGVHGFVTESRSVKKSRKKCTD
jgi:hypothetical protein